jgi:hypothetical protein
MSQTGRHGLTIHSILNLGKARAIVYTSSILSQGQELSVDKLWKTVDKQPPLGKTGENASRT